jgi:hypothetical protein
MQAVEHVVQEHALRPLVDPHRPKRHRRPGPGEPEGRGPDPFRRNAQLRLHGFWGVALQELLKRRQIHSLLAIAETNVAVHKAFIIEALGTDHLSQRVQEQEIGTRYRREVDVGVFGGACSARIDADERPSRVSSAPALDAFK